VLRRPFYIVIVRTSLLFDSISDPKLIYCFVLSQCSVHPTQFYQVVERTRCEPIWPCSEIISSITAVSHLTAKIHTVVDCTREINIISEEVAHVGCPSARDGRSPRTGVRYSARPYFPSPKLLKQISTKFGIASLKLSGLFNFCQGG
jgi:hypothetical protein